MKSYEKQEKEGQVSFELFQKYLQLGENRNLEKLSEYKSISIKKLKFYSKKWNWEKRANDYDSDRKVISFKHYSKKPKKLLVEIANEIMNHCNSIKITLEQFKINIPDSERIFYEKDICQMLDKMGIIAKLLDELIKVAKIENNQNETDNFVDEIFEKIGNDNELFNLAHDLLSKLAED